MIVRVYDEIKSKGYEITNNAVLGKKLINCYTTVTRQMSKPLVK